ncbi:MAG: hypothetical protein Q8914_08435, partial [Bacteroidota bacterium]|nr:hypothetical protein [Bacteroidota bacterium]
GSTDSSIDGQDQVVKRARAGCGDYEKKRLKNRVERVTRSFRLPRSKATLRKLNRMRPGF